MLKRKNIQENNSIKKAKVFLSKEQANQYNNQGYIVVKDKILTDEECQILKDKVFEFTNSMFKGEDIKIDPRKPETFQLLTNKDYRDKNLKNPNSIYHGGTSKAGNTRMPLVPKNSGMSCQYYQPEKLKIIDSNEKLYEVASTLYDTNQLKLEPSRWGIKAPNSTKMPEHLDCPFFDFNYNPGTRVQSFVVIDKPIDVKVSNSGTIQLVPYFNKYFKLAQHVFHPITGVEELKYPKKHENSNQVYCKPKMFNLSLFNEYIKMYTLIQEGKHPQGHVWYQHAKQIYDKYDIKVPEKAIKLEWRAINIPIGHMFCWDSTLPHCNLPNKSKKSCRIVYYYCSYKQENNYHQTDQFKRIKNCFKNCKPFFTNYSIEPALSEEEYSGDYVIENNYTKLKDQSPLFKALYGFDRNTLEDYTWEDYYNKI